MKKSIFTTNKKGILLTLLMVVMLILMVGELTFYIALNTNYNTLAESGAEASSQGSFAGAVPSELSGFLHTDLYASILALNRYENTSSLRYGNFITNTSQELSSLVVNGTVFSTNMSKYIGTASLNVHIANLEKQAAAQGINLTFQNSNVIIYQTTPYAINITYTGIMNATTAYGKLSIPLFVNSSVNLNGLPDLLATQEGYPYQVYLLPNAPQAKLIGGTTAEIGSHSAFMSVYGTALSIPAGSTCSAVPLQDQNANYILIDGDSGALVGTCGTAGLITCNSDLAGSISVPWLAYAPGVCSSVLNGIYNGTQILLDGAVLGAYNISAIQAEQGSGYFFPSQYAPSYLERSEGGLTQSSTAGITSLGQYSRETTAFNKGLANTPADTPSPSLDALDVGDPGITLAAWIEPTNLSTCGFSGVAFCEIIAKNGAYLLGIDGAGNLYFAINNTGSSWNWYSANADIRAGNYYFAAASYDGNTIRLYVDGSIVRSISSYGNIDYTKAGNQQPLSIGALSQSGGPVAYFIGRISDAQVYNIALPPNAIMSMYQQGFGSPPVSGLVGWWPLYGNANDYSGNMNNAVFTPSGVSFTPLVGYSGDPLLQGPQTTYSIKAARMVASSSDYINITSRGVNGFSFGDNPSSSFAWVYPISYPSSGAWSMVDFYGSSTSTPAVTRTLSINPAGNACFNSGGNDACDALQLKLNAWNFIGYSYLGGTENTVTIFLNGNSVSTNLAKALSTSPSNAYIGAYAGPGYFFNGSIADVQVYNSAIPPAQEMQLYSSGISGGPVAMNSIVGWWPLNGNAQDYSTYNNNGNLEGTTTFTQVISQPVPTPIYGVQGCNNPTQCTNSTLQQMMLGARPLTQSAAGWENESTALGLPFDQSPGAMSFNGAGYLNESSGILWVGEGASSFSFSIWVYPTNSYGVIVDEVASGGWHDSFINMVGGTGYVRVWDAPSCTSLGSIPLNAWSNIVLSYNQSSKELRGFLNGILKGSQSLSRTAPTKLAYYPIGIGDVTSCGTSTAYNYQGSAADFKLYNVGLSAAQALQLYQNDSVINLPANMIWELNSGNNGAMNQTPESITGDTGVLYNSSSGLVQCSSASVVSGLCPEEYVP